MCIGRCWILWKTCSCFKCLYLKQGSFRSLSWRLFLSFMGVHGRKCTREALQAADKPINFSALYLCIFKAQKGLLGTWRLLFRLLTAHTYWESNLFILSFMFWTFANHCIKNLVSNVTLLCLIWTSWRCLLHLFYVGWSLKNEILLLERIFESSCSIQCPAQLQEV